MFNLASLLMGLLALLVAMVGFLPLLGWLNWLAIPLAFVGLVIGLLSRGRAGRAVCAVVLAGASLRLWAGAGIF
ncbi:MAG: hypothetical protein A4S12_12325 [Proteobacteria bacterium SG_bin5]|nr:hypothetical protein [Sphingomonas sp.]OQW38633.1 MAG: hypothetical protein A4S12_12325 [Proteobacteria bacterium SG_bin5]